MLTTSLIPAVQKDSHRLMIVLHGLGDSMDGYRWVPQTLDLPWMNYLLVNAPDEYFGGYSWFEFEGDAQPGIERSRKLLFGLIAEMTGKGYPVKEMTLFGFSQGCLMAMETGLRYPEVFAGLVCVSGFIADLDGLISGLSPVAAQQRLLVTHGTYDPLLRIDKVHPQIQKLQKQGLNIQWHELPKEHSIAGETEISLIRDFTIAGYPPAK
jgi:phospholipase/carboxylesterase